MDFGQYVGIPFLAHGRDRKGLDCYGLIRLFYAEQMGAVVPEYLSQYPQWTESMIGDCFDSAMEDKVTWQRITVPKPGDIVVLAVKGIPAHCGIQVDKNRFLHSRSGICSCIERYNRPQWRGRVVAYYQLGSVNNAEPEPANDRPERQHDLSGDAPYRPVPAGYVGC